MTIYEKVIKIKKNLYTKIYKASASCDVDIKSWLKILKKQCFLYFTVILWPCPTRKFEKIIPMTTKPLSVVFITRTAGEWYVGKGEEKKT